MSAETRRSRGQHDWPHAMLRRLDDRLPCRPPRLFQVFDLHDQYHRVADQNADQRQHAENGDESERCAARQQGQTTPIKARGATANTRNKRWKLCS